MKTSTKEEKLLNRITELEKELAAANKKIVALDIPENLAAEQVGKHADEMIRESEETFRNIIEQISEIIFLTDDKGTIIYISPTSSNIFGYTPQEMEGQFFMKYLKRTEIPKAMKEFLITVTTGSPTLNIELLMKQKSGKIFSGELVGKRYKTKNFKGTIGTIRDITERKQAEEALRESEAKFKSIVENGSPVIFTIDKDGKFLLSEGKSLEKLGLKPGQVVGMSAFEVYKDYPSILKGINEALAGNTFMDVVEVGDVYFDVFYTPNKDDSGYFESITGMAIDITERKQAEDALKESEERFSRLSDLTYEGILIHKDGLVIDANKTLENLSGYSREELIGKNIFQRIIPQKYHELLIKNLKEESVLPYEIEGIKKDGTIIHIEIESRNIDYGDNKRVRVTAVRDISQRKQSELEIKKLLNAIEQTPVSIVITNIEGSIEYVNPKFTEITGYTAEEAYNQNPRVLKSGDQSEEYYKNLWETISSGNIWAGEFHNKKKNGELFWESAIISPVKDNEGKITHYIAVKEDITEKKKMIEDLIISKEKAVNANKMKDIFLAQMSHEIRTPINAMVSMSSLLRYDFEEGADEDQIMSFEVVDRAGKRIIRTVDLLLNLSEIQAGTYTPNLTKVDILEDVLSILLAEYKKSAAKKNINLNLESNMIDTELEADSYTVNQIFEQLIDNAIKYTLEGGVTIRALRNDLDQLIVEIKDTGIGIDEEYLPNLFEPFSQEEMGYTRKFEGNGIGMALVKKYCDLNNAEIEVESTKGVGSTFRVIFKS